MGTRAIENRIKKLQEIETQQKALEEQAEKIKAEIKSEMEAQGTEELNTGNFIIRWKTILNNRFDTKAFSVEHKKLYEQYMKQSQRDVLQSHRGRQDGRKILLDGGHSGRIRASNGSSEKQRRTRQNT